MSRLRERHFLPATFTNDKIHDSVVAVDDITIFNWTATDTTVTPTRVDNGVSPGATGNVTFNGTDTVAAANLQTAIRALGGIYANVVVTAGVTADNMLIRTPGGYNITWVKTGGTGSITETGAAGSDTAVVGSITYSKQVPIGKFAEVKKIVVKGFIDDVTKVSVVDADGKLIFGSVASPITLDTSTAGVDAPFVKLITADGVAGEDGAAASNTNGGVFRGPATVTVVLGGPISTVAGMSSGAVVDRPRAPRLTLVFDTDGAGGGGGIGGRLVERTQVLTAAGQSKNINIGTPLGKIRKIKLLSSSDTTVDPTVTDADGLVAYTKSSTNFTTAVIEQVSHEGFDQANNAVADLLDVVVKSPLTIATTLLTAGTFTVTVWVEV